jgi:hypothetical protein
VAPAPVESAVPDADQRDRPMKNIDPGQKTYCHHRPDRQTIAV